MAKNNDNFLLYVPAKKHKYYEIKKGKVFLIFHHDKPVEKIMRWLIKKPYVSDIELDTMGSRVWELINGQNTVYDIGKELIKVYSKECEPVYDRLILYIRYLIKKGWISFDRGNQEGGSSNGIK